VEALAAILDRLTAKQRQLATLLPLPEPFAASLEHKLRLELTHASNAIEGNTLTLRETQLLIDEGLTPAGKQLREIHEVINHDAAVKRLYGVAREPGPISERQILDLHAQVLRNIDDAWAGRYRATRVFVKGSPLIPPNPLKVPELMEAFAAWLAGAELHPVLLAAEAHYRFAKIHPFVDGNGRTARLLMNLVLLRHGYPLTVIPAEQRADYIKALDLADLGDPEPFRRLMLACVERSLDLSLSVND
jgi:Fic family protein